MTKSVSDNKLRGALEKLPPKILKEYCEERNLEISGRSKEPYIDALASLKWTPEEFQGLKDHIKRLELERQHFGWYFSDIEGISDFNGDLNPQNVKNKLLRNKAEKSKGELTEDGFEIGDIESNGLSAAYWTKNTEYYLDAFNNLEPDVRTYAIFFEIDTEEERLSIKPNSYGKVREVKSELESLGFVFGKGSHDHLKQGDANDMVKGFVEDLKDDLEKADVEEDPNQANLGDFE